MRTPRPRIFNCTVTYDDGTECNTESVSSAPFPICAKHLRHAYLFARDMMSTFTGTDNGSILFMLNERDKWNEKRIEQAAKFTHPGARNGATDGEPVVYYVLVGDLIKIGTSTNLRSRLASYPPDHQLLATEPGSYDLESVRLDEFREYHTARREWFTMGQRLLEHIQTLRSQAA